MNLPKGNKVVDHSDTFEPTTVQNETVEHFEQPSNNETKGRGRPKGVRSFSVIQNEILYKKSQIEKQVSRIESFQNDIDKAKFKCETFQSEIEVLESQLKASQN